MKSNKLHIVLTDHASEGFVTGDRQLAYEVRKGAIDNCYDEEGGVALTARAFCTDHSIAKDCSTYITTKAVLTRSDDILGMLNTPVVVMVDGEKVDSLVEGVSVDIVIRDARKLCHIFELMKIETLLLDHYLETDYDTGLTGRDVLFDLLLSDTKSFPSSIVFISTDNSQNHLMANTAIEQGQYELWEDCPISVEGVCSVAVKLKSTAT